METENVDVCFRKFANGDVIAFIEGYAVSRPGLVMSYEHVGQHGEASEDLIDELKPATADEYNDLLRELESIGYVVTIVDDIR